MRTTATYIPETQEFEINTPNFEAAKCWAGNLGTHTFSNNCISTNTIYYQNRL